MVTVLFTCGSALPGARSIPFKPRVATLQISNNEKKCDEKLYLGMLAVLLLTGCAGPVHQMVKEGNAPFIGGELIHDRGKSNRPVLQASNRRLKLMDSPSNTRLTWQPCASAILLLTGSIGIGYLPGSTPAMRFFPSRRLPYPQMGPNSRAV